MVVWELKPVSLMPEGQQRLSECTNCMKQSPHSPLSTTWQAMSAEHGCANTLAQENLQLVFSKASKVPISRVLIWSGFRGPKQAWLWSVSAAMMRDMRLDPVSFLRVANPSIMSGTDNLLHVWPLMSPLLCTLICTITLCCVGSESKYSQHQGRIVLHGMAYVGYFSQNGSITWWSLSPLSINLSKNTFKSTHKMTWIWMSMFSISV